MKNPIRQSRQYKSLIPAWVAVLSACLLSSGASADPKARSEQKTKTIRWVVAHARDDKAFSGLLDGFAHRLDERSSGALKVEFVDSLAESSRRDIEADKIAYQQILDGKADMSQLGVGRLGVRVIDLPFMFRSYEHAEAVWRSPVGKKLLSEVSSSSQGKIKGLAFAYSGGYRILVGETAIRQVSDFKGLKMRDTGGGPADLLSEFGVKFVKIDPAEVAKSVPVALPASGKVDLEETEVNGLAYIQQRYPEVVKQVKYVNLTRHSMLVTSMVASEKFLGTLSADQRRLLNEEVAALAAAERMLSVELSKRNIERMGKEGMSLVSLPAAEEQKFVKAAEAVYKKTPELAGLIREIGAVKEIPLQAAAPSEKGLAN